MKHLVENRTWLSDVIGYLYKGLTDDSQITVTNKNINDTFNFPLISKYKIFKSLVGILNQIDHWNKNTDQEERSNEILNLDAYEDIILG